MTLAKLFYFLNFFVRPKNKKRRQKCAKTCPKCAPPHPPDPPRPIFLVEGDEFYLTHAKQPHNFALESQSKLFGTHHIGPKTGPPDPPDTQKSIFLVGGGVGSNLLMPKNAITLLFRLLSSFFTFEGLLGPKCAKNWPPPDPPCPKKHIGTLNFSFLLKNRPI